MMKRCTIIWGMLFWTIMAMAQQPQQQNGGRHFSPEKFESELYQFIIREAGLTQEECAKFFPVYKEMRKKQRGLFERQRNASKVKPADEKGCMKVVQDRDNIEVEQKRLQQTYHNKFFDVLPASKVYDILQAEDKFHRGMLRQWGHRQKQPEDRRN